MEVCEYCGPDGPCTADDCGSCCWCHRELGPSEVERLRSDLAATKVKLAAAEAVIAASDAALEFNHRGEMHDRNDVYGKLDAARAAFTKLEGNKP